VAENEIVLRCAVCNLPWAKIRNGVLIVESRHHGAIHVNVIAVDEVVRLRSANAPAWLGEVEEKGVDGRQ
jgi:hypothetical protein